MIISVIKFFIMQNILFLLILVFSLAVSVCMKYFLDADGESLKDLFRKETFKNFIKKKRILNIIEILILTAIVGGSLSYIFYQIHFVMIGINPIYQLLIMIISFLVVSALTFLAYFDYKTMEIPDTFSLYLLIGLIILNLVLLVIGGFNNSYLLWYGNLYTPIYNFLCMFIFGGLLGLIVFLSKGKAMGEGDIRIAMILGLILGLDKILSAFYIMIISAAIIGVIIMVRKKKFHGIAIPLVPFMVFGTIMAFLFSYELFQIFYSVLSKIIPVG